MIRTDIDGLNMAEFTASDDVTEKAFKQLTIAFESYSIQFHTYRIYVITANSIASAPDMYNE